LLRGAPSALAGDDLIALPASERAFQFADDDRLDDAVRLDRPGQLFELKAVTALASDKF